MPDIQSTFRYPPVAPEIMLPFIPANCRRLLDVGCAGGEFGAMIKQRVRAEVWGIDPSSEVVDRATRNLDRFIPRAFDEMSGLPLHYFDVVTFNDSLEHFADPWAVLRLVQQHLAPGGSVIMSVPNVRYVDNVYHLVFEMDWRYRERGILDSTHLRFFTKKSLVRTLESEHFVVEKITGIRGKYWIGRAARPFVRLFGEWL